MGPIEEHGARVLTRRECFELLSRESVGHIGVSIDALPVILPVHFALLNETVLFRTIPGTKLDAATIGAVVAFQADGWEQLDQTYWSVLLQGIASEANHESDDALSRSVSIRPWGSVEHRGRLIRLEAPNASGSRFRIGGEAMPPEFPDAPSLET